PVHDTGLLTGSSGPAPPRSPGGPPAPPSGPGVGAARPGQSGSPPYTASHAAAADTSGTGNDPPAAKTTWPSAGVRSGRSRSVRNQPAEIARATTSLTCPAGGTVSGSSGTNPEAQASAWPEARHARATASARRANSSRTSDRSGAAPPVSGGGAQAASSSRIRPAVAWRADMWVGRREEDPGSRVLRTPRPGRAAPVRWRQPSYSALPRRYSSQLRVQSVQPSPGVTLLVVPSTITGSPQRWVRLNSHSALSRDMLMQPWVTFSVPSSAPERTVAWMNSPLRVYRIAYSMSTRYPSSGPSSSKVSNTVSWNFSMITWMPLDEGYSARPRLTGMVRTTSPPSRTVICWVAASTVIVISSPTVTLTRRSLRRYRSSPTGRPPVVRS